MNGKRRLLGSFPARINVQRDAVSHRSQFHAWTRQVLRMSGRWRLRMLNGDLLRGRQ